MGIFKSKEEKHVLELTKEHGIGVIYDPCGVNGIAFYGSDIMSKHLPSLFKGWGRGRWNIVIPLPSNTYYYSTALHEIGHILHPDGMMASNPQRMFKVLSPNYVDNLGNILYKIYYNARLVGEISAWMWAVKNAISLIPANKIEVPLSTYFDESPKPHRKTINLLRALCYYSGADMNNIYKDYD